MVPFVSVSYGNIVSEVDTALIYRGDSVCFGETVRLSIDLKHKVGPLSYAWNAIPSGSFIIQNGTTATPSVSTALTTELPNAAQWKKTGVHFLKITVTDHGTTPPRVLTDTVSFTVFANPMFTITPHQGDFCLNDGQPATVTLKTSSGLGEEAAPYVYAWGCDRNQITTSKQLEEVQAQVLLGCNSYTLSVSDKHGCSGSDLVELQGHEFEVPISLAVPPECLKYAVVQTSAPECPGCACGACARECGCLPIFRVEWGPSTLISGNGMTATTKSPVWQTINVWVAMRDPVGCVDTSWLTIPMTGCKEPEPELSLANLKICEDLVPYTLKAKYKEGIGPVTFQWIVPATWGTSSGPSITIPKGWSGCTDVTVKMTDHGLSVPKTISATANICVYALPELTNLISSKPEACIGEEVLLTSPIYGKHGVYYNWRTNGYGPIIDHNDGTATAVINESFNSFFLQATTDLPGCYSEVGIFVRGHEVSANISALPGGFSCEAMYGTLTASGSFCSEGDPIHSFQWEPPWALNQTSGMQVTTMPIVSPTLFTLHVSDEFGCRDKAELMIGGGLCDVKIKGDTVCEHWGYTVNARPSLMIAGGNPMIQWRPISNEPYIIYDAQSPNPTIDMTGLPPGDYPIEAWVSDGATQVVHTTLIRVAPIPEVQLFADTLFACTGDSIRLVAKMNTPGDGNRYYWLNGAVGKETDSVGFAIPGVAGMATYVLKTESRYRCVTYDTIKISSLPRVLLCGNSECVGTESYKGLISVLNGKPPYTFYHDAELTLPVANVTWNTNRTLATIPNLKSEQAYRFYVGGSRLCETSSVDVYKACECYTGAYVTTDSLGCGSTASSTKIRIQAFGSVFYSFQLVDPKGNVVLNVDREGRTTWEYTVQRADAGRYKLVNLTGFISSTDVDGCTGDVYGEANVTFPAPLHFTLSADKLAGCLNDTVNLAVNGLTSDVLHQWSTRKGGKVFFPDSVATPACITGDSNLFVLTANAGSGCIEVQQIAVVGHQVKGGRITVTPSTKLVCDEVGTLTANGYACPHGDALTYTWSPADKLQTSTGAVTTTGVLKGQTTFQVVVQDALGCQDSSLITVYTGICHVSVNGDTLCSGSGTAHPSVLIEGGSPSIEWKDESLAHLHFDDPYSAFPSIDVSGLAQGTYPISVTITDGTEQQTLRTAIQLIDNPIVSLHSDKLDVCVGDPVNLNVAVIPTSGKYTYYWLQGATGDEQEDVSTTIVAKTGANDYLVKVVDAMGCTGYDSIVVTGRLVPYLCAENRCVDKNSFHSLITVQNGTPPYSIYRDSALTIPETSAIWNAERTQVSIADLISDSSYTYYFSGTQVCTPVSITVTEHCLCMGTTTVCDAVMLLSAEALDCTSPKDSVTISMQAWGAEAFSFRLTDPLGRTVFSTTNDTATEWRCKVASHVVGQYRVDDFFGHSAPDTDCSGIVFGSAQVLPLDTIVIDAGADQYVCEGEQVTLSASGNACDFRWSGGVINGVAFTPSGNGIYTVVGKNLIGCEATDSVQIFRNNPVVITAQSADVVVDKGLDAHFFVQTIPFESVSFEWQHEDLLQWHTLTDGGSSPQLKGSRTNQLSVHQIPFDWNRTRVRCIARNGCGSDTAYFNIIVTGCTENGSVTLQMEQGITPDTNPHDPIDGWFCRGVRIGVRALIAGIDPKEKLIYKWTIDGIPTEHSTTEYISWIPALWEDDIILKVCVYSPNLCNVVCAQYIRLKSKVFERSEARIITSADPELMVCPGENVTLDVAGQGLGATAEYQWYHDIFEIGKGQQQLFTMTDKDVWIRLIAKVSDEVCTQHRVLEDTVHLRFKKNISPTLRLQVSPDTLVCPGEPIRIKAIVADAGVSPTFQWRADIEDIGTGRELSYTISEEDTWFRCQMTPGNDVCYTGEPLSAYVQVKVTEKNGVATLTSDLESRLPGEAVTFTVKTEHIQGKLQYKWMVSDAQMQNQTAQFKYMPREGEAIKCCISGVRSCQKEICSNVLTTRFASQSRDTLIHLRKGEQIQKLNIALAQDKGRIFTITEIPQNGTATLSFAGLLNYVPKGNFSGGDALTYSIKDKTTRETIAEGTVYITVLEQGLYDIPNLITPNGDGINDYWNIEWIDEYPDNVVLIYNPKNRLVFSAVNYKNDFNGTYIESNGTPHQLPSGVYTYVVSLKNKKEFKSWLEIRR